MKNEHTVAPTNLEKLKEESKKEFGRIYGPHAEWDDEMDILIEKAFTAGKEERERPIFSVGYHKGEMDFGVNGSIEELSYEEMRHFREMLVVGIGQAERMWGMASEKREPTSSAARTNKSLD